MDEWRELNGRIEGVIGNMGKGGGERRMLG